MINTIDPENVQAMLARQFCDFGLGPRRKETFDPLIGRASSQQGWPGGRLSILDIFPISSIT